MHYVETGHLALFQAEEIADLLDVSRGRRLGRHFTADAVHLPLRNVRRLDQVIVGQLVVAGRVGGRHHALIHPKQVDVVPAELHRCQLLEKQLGRRPARNREGDELLAG